KQFLVAGIFLLICLFMLRWSSGDTVAEMKEEISALFELPQMVKAPKIEAQYTFAGEEVPMNVDTRERLERELLTNSYYHTATTWALKMHKRYFPLIEKVLKENGVPEDFKYLAVAESNLMNATSSAGAKGVWQFMTPTAKEFGMRVDEEVDERYHIEKSTEAAAKYLKQLKNMTGSWVNAAAAYNAGPGRLRSSQSAQKQNSYFDLHMNEETSRYVFRIMAIREIMSNPSRYGYQLDEGDYYQPYDQVKKVVVDQTKSNLADFAKAQGTTYRMLRYYNPWIIGDKLTVVNKSYTLTLPQ
ncbi:MAG TPA: lytic transglycosylase domain-containing protein, partial [Saprospiraceae bacterium]|nr:lytic transglycosylase domain-containing protein [Saprospiraceae bacterium]